MNTFVILLHKLGIILTCLCQIWIGALLLQVVTKKEVVTRTEYLEMERQGEVMERPMSVAGESLPVGPGKYLEMELQGEVMERPMSVAGESLPVGPGKAACTQICDLNQEFDYCWVLPSSTTHVLPQIMLYKFGHPLCLIWLYSE